MLVNDDDDAPSSVRCRPRFFFCCRRGAARALDEGEWIDPVLPGRRRAPSSPVGAGVGADAPNGSSSPTSVADWEKDMASDGTRLERMASLGNGEGAQSRGSLRSDRVRGIDRRKKRAPSARRVRWSDHPLVPFKEEKLDDAGPLGNRGSLVRQGGCSTVDVGAGLGEKTAAEPSDRDAEVASYASDGSAEEKKDDGDDSTPAFSAGKYGGAMKQPPASASAVRYDSIAATGTHRDISARLSVSVLTSMDKKAVADYVEAWQMKNEWPELDRYARHL